MVSCVVLAGYLAALRIDAVHGTASRQRWLSDADDLTVYHRRAQWYAAGGVPYRDVFSEYPTLATLAFAAPYWLPGGSGVTLESYRHRWQALMAAALLATILLVARFRHRHGLRPEAALLLLLPSALYFSLMRFDILCALLMCVSLAAFSRERYVLAHVVLAIATFVKWYPAVVFPVYLAFHLSHEQGLSWRRPTTAWLRTTTLRAGGAFVVTMAAITVGSIAWFTFDGFMAPYRFHGYRPGQYFNPYWLLERFGPSLGMGRVSWWIVNRAFLALQLLIVPILLIARMRSLTDVFRYAVLAIVLFITFARVDSPQWILWYLPPVLMFARSASTLWVVAALALWNYVVFPVAYDAYGEETAPAFSAIVFVKDLIVIALMVLIFREHVPTPVPVPRDRALGDPAAAGSP